MKLGWGLVTSLLCAVSQVLAVATPERRAPDASIGVELAPLVERQVALPRWNFTDKSKTVYGVNLGNMLLIERWMDPIWWDSIANGTGDQWGFMQRLGPSKTGPILRSHYNNFVSEADLDLMKSYGINHVRIPMGFWSWIGVQPGEPYRNYGEKTQLTKLLGWLNARGMYATLSMHGMPGSQSGDQSTGQATDQALWFTNTNQKRSDQVVDQLIQYIVNSPYRTTVSSVIPVNEPCGWRSCNPQQLSITQAFYQRSYNKLKAAKIPMIFHHGFLGLPAWTGFVKGKDPNYIIGSNAWYGGGWPAKTDRNVIYGDLCNYINVARTYPCPVLTAEWSLVSNINLTAFQTQFYNTQAAGYAKSAGSCVWSWSVYDKDVTFNRKWSFKHMVARGLVPKPNSTQLTSLRKFITTLPNQQC